MGKTLYIVRHAEARSKESGEKDIDRTLTPGGMQLASRIGHYFAKNNSDISAIICSAAERAKQTAEQISMQLKFDLSKIEVDDELYEASVRILLKKVNELPKEIKEVLIIGHNPVLSYFVEYLSGHFFDGMAAGSIVKIACGVDDWQQITNESATFEYYVSPEDLKSA